MQSRTMARSSIDYLVNNRLTRPMRAALERRALVSRRVRSLANRLYNATDDAGRQTLYERSAKIFRNHPATFSPGTWDIDVPPFRLRMPLRGEHAWLDWDSALSVLGHDTEVKNFYAKLLDSRFRPDVFCDIGANYGVHTALFLSAGVPSVAFEPNPSCRPYFKLLVDLNDFKDATWEEIALGDANGNATLTYPERDTWFGSIRLDKGPDLAPMENLTTRSIRIRRLDDNPIQGKRCFAKIDTEGSEIRVIRGGRTFFREQCPFFVFESNYPAGRDEIFDEVTLLGFSVEALPIRDIEEAAPLPRCAFIEARGTNFLARRQRN